MKTLYRILCLTILLLISSQLQSFAQSRGVVYGKVTSTEGEAVGFVNVYLDDTNFGNSANKNGDYRLEAPAGEYTLVVSSIGYETVEQKIRITAGQRIKQDITIKPEATELEEVVVTASGVSRVRQSAYNAVAIDTRALLNSSQSLGDALTRAPGLKLRESGGVGSDMQLMLDGFSGRHVKIFIDGVPQEGVGSSFGLNNIPINFAERIEVYKGVVPVGFGTDAIGGVINIVTKKDTRRSKNHWFLDASYSFGSFNTHKSYINFRHTLKNGFTYELNFFQNYSDNNYYIDAVVEEFTESGSQTNKDITYRVRRFHDTYHNEAAVAKFGVVGKKWADRLMFGVTYSQMHKDIQTGVRQEVVFGGKYSEGNSVMPSIEYFKRNFLTRGLDVTLTGNYNRNVNNNVDTSYYHYNWFGEKKLMSSPGEQSYQHTRSLNDNWNGTFTANYRVGKAHTFSLNHVMSSFQRNNRSMLGAGSSANAIPKQTTKNITGFSYRLMPSVRWNVSLFGKYYNQFVAGPIAVTSAQDSFVRTTKSVDAFGYGAAGTYFIIKGLQAKLSYEKAYRLPTEGEMFGDEDLESGDIGLKPENSDNINFALSYDRTFGNHSVYLEGGVIYRNTKDYIQREITNLSGGKSGAGYVNHAQVLTKGYTLSVRYGFSKWLSVGGTFTQMDARDNVKTTLTGSANNKYGARMPNVPYQFANSDVTFYWHNLGRKGNMLTVTYDNLYLHSFPLRSEALGSWDSKAIVPTQFAHNISVSYSIKNGRYNISLECRNFTNEKLYDNFSLQKAGRAFYGKLRIYFGN